MITRTHCMPSCVPLPSFRGRLVALVGQKGVVTRCGFYRMTSMLLDTCASRTHWLARSVRARGGVRTRMPPWWPRGLSLTPVVRAVAGRPSPVL